MTKTINKLIKDVLFINKQMINYKSSPYYSYYDGRRSGLFLELKRFGEFISNELDFLLKVVEHSDIKEVNLRIEKLEKRLEQIEELQKILTK